MDHNHAHVAASERALWLALGLVGFFLVVEVSEATHMRMDKAALVIALAAITADLDRRASKSKS